MDELDKLRQELDLIIEHRHPIDIWGAEAERRYADGLKAKIARLEEEESAR